MRPLLALALLILPLAAAPVPRKVKAQGVIVVRETLRSPALTNSTVVTTLTPDGKVLGELSFKPGLAVYDGPISPDGTRLVVLTEGPRPKGAEQTWLVHLVNLKTPDKLPEPSNTVFDAHLCWSAHGKHLLEPKIDTPFAAPEPGDVGGLSVIEHTPGKDTVRTVSFGCGQLPVCTSHDGQSWLSRQYADRGGARGAEWQTFLTTPDTAGPVPVGDTDFHPKKFLPDGKRVFGMKNTGAGGFQSRVLDLLTNKDTQVPWPAELKGKATGQLCLSPDGSAMAVTWYEEVDRPEGWPAREPCLCVRLGVCDADGGGLRTVFKSTRPTATVLSGGAVGVQWR